ncbi:unnamed protein product [Rotaria sp. Silwood2]|nr:unnamed protein product [Rotaria sp. Silwood2]CAF3150855.1 unnamed protein product [Rotaria sp. Silwood2]CAF3439633.1 unnamed protein product [Rotaria sp. Silwood2]CAF4152139.1 unnamed protein product [Rotaria sp. Silwood2]CAF4467758.1 unnamed protein product [Rotaria sp. Silwood2]
MGLPVSKIASYFSRKEDVRVLMWGLDAAGKFVFMFLLLIYFFSKSGKTTALYAMKLGEVVTTIPTIGFNVETVEFKNIKMTAWDVGGRDKIRPLWRHYYQNTKAIVFVVDSNDRERVNDASEQLHSILKEDELRDIPVLILANKQDLPNAMSPSELTDKLDLEKLTRQRKWHIQATVATQKKGLQEGFEWLGDALVKKNVNIFQPVMETVNDSKVMKDDILSMFHSASLKLFFAKFIQY